MTELEAVNLVLPALGEDMITSVDDPSSSAALVTSLMKYYTNQTLQRAWWFNVTRLNIQKQTDAQYEAGYIATWGLQDFIPDDQKWMVEGARIVNRLTGEPWLPAGETITGWGIRRVDWDNLPEIVQQFIVAQVTVHAVTNRHSGDANVQVYLQQVHTLQDAMTQTHLRHMRNVVLPAQWNGVVPNNTARPGFYGVHGRLYNVRGSRVDGSYNRLGG